MGKKESSNQIEAWRKKNKVKERTKVKELRKEQFESKLKAGDFNDAETELARLRELKDKGKLGFDGEHRLQRQEKYVSLYAPELKQKQRDAQERTEEEKRADLLDRKQRVARFSVYYHAEDNPLGIPPPGEPPKYRHPDGSVRPNPPYDDEEAEENLMKKRRAEHEGLQIPGFSAGMMAKIRKDAEKAAVEEEREARKAAGAAFSDEDEEDEDGENPSAGPSSKKLKKDPKPVLYIPPVPEEPYPFYEPPEMEEPPIVDDLQLLRDTVQAIANVREALVQNVLLRSNSAPSSSWGGGGPSYHGGYGGKNSRENYQKGGGGGKNKDGKKAGKGKKDGGKFGKGRDDDDVKLGGPSSGAATAGGRSPKAAAAGPGAQGPAGPKNNMLLDRLKRGKAKQTDLSYLKTQVQVSAASTTTKEEDVDMSRFLNEIGGGNSSSSRR
eukprot:g1467.t1